jgi:hypothetical protein
MKFVSVIATALLATCSLVSGRVGMGGCPVMTSVPYNAAMDSTNTQYVHFVDTLIYNGYTLYKLIVEKKYNTFDCQRVPGFGTFSNSGFDENAYNDIIANYMTSSKMPYRAAVTAYDATTKTYVFQACIDINYLSVFLTSFLAGGGEIPQWAQIIIGISTWVLKFAHFQASVVMSEEQAIVDDAADETDLYSILAGLLTNAPGAVNIGWLSQLNVSNERCGNFEESIMQF